MSRGGPRGIITGPDLCIRTPVGVTLEARVLVLGVVGQLRLERLAAFAAGCVGGQR
jgi:hypothetical protein